MKAVAMLVMLCLTTAVATDLPIIRIWTQDEATIDSKEIWTNIESFSLTDPNNPDNDFVRQDLEQKDRIRGRGNATWVQGRTFNSYRIKFRDDISIFGLPARENWVLLMELGTALKNSFGFEMGQRLELQYTCSYNPVEIYLNGEYGGVYLLTEHRQADPLEIGVQGRPKVHLTEGWFVEIDSYYDELPKFRTEKYNLPIMLKTPEFGEDINDPRYDAVRNDWNELTELMASASFPENGYRDLIDIDSFVKYFLVQTFMQNLDFLRVDTQRYGSTFFYKDKEGKISAGPLWDLDWTFMTTDESYTFGEFGPTLYPYIVRPEWFRRFFDDPMFLARYKEIWNEYLTEIETMGEFIDDIADKMNYYGYFSSYMKDFFDQRLNFLNTEYNKIDPTPIITKRISSSNANAHRNVEARVYNMRGQRVENHLTTPGIYLVKTGNQTRKIVVR